MRAAIRRLHGALEVGLAGALLIVSALIFGSAPLLVPGLALLMLGVLLPVWVWLSLQTGHVRRRVGRDRVLEGEPFEVLDEVTRGALGLPGAELIDPLAGEPVPLGRALSPIDGRSQTDVRLSVRLHRRGLHRLASPALAATDPLGLVKLHRLSDEPPHELLVLPRTEPVSWPAARAGRPGRGDDLGFGEPPGAVDIDGLRPYREGTSASRIHWPALARGAGLLERRLTPDGDNRPLVVLDLRDGGRREEVESAVRAAASLALALARSVGCRLLLPGERRAVIVGRDLIGWPAVHARLALVAAGEPAVHLGALFGDAVVFWVAAPTPARLPAALLRAREATLVLPGQVQGRRGMPTGLRVSGCMGFRVGRTSLGAGRPETQPEFARRRA